METSCQWNAQRIVFKLAEFVQDGKFELGIHKTGAHLIWTPALELPLGGIFDVFILWRLVYPTR